MDEREAVQYDRQIRLWGLAAQKRYVVCAGWQARCGAEFAATAVTVIKVIHPILTFDFPPLPFHAAASAPRVCLSAVRFAD